MRSAWALALVLVSLGLAACQGRLDPALVQGEYQVQTAQVSTPGSKEPSTLTLNLKLLPNDQALLIKDPGQRQASSQYGIWSLSGNKLTVILFKDDNERPADMVGNKKIVDGTLVLTVKRSTRTLWLEDQQGSGPNLKGLEFKKL